MPPPLQPEFFILLGLDLFLATSMLTCLLDKYFPWQLPYLCQLASLVGFGQLLVSREFLVFFDEYMRFWYSLTYLVIALATIVAINVYLGFMKKLLNYAKAIMFTVTFPSLAIAVFFIVNYAEIAAHPLIIGPQMTWEATFIGIVTLDTFVVGVGTYVFFKPKWWYIALGAGAAIAGASVYAFLKPSWGESTFVVSAIALAIACVLVLGVSVYVLARLWIDTLRERKRKREVK
jgi:hypothetical protein